MANKLQKSHVHENGFMSAEYNRANQVVRVSVSVDRDLQNVRSAYEAWKREPQRLFEKSPEAILVFDNSLRYVDANPAAQRLLCRSKDQIVGTRIGGFSAQAEGAGLAERVFEHDVVMEEKLNIVLPDGGSRAVRLVTRPNLISGLHVAFMRDETEIRQLQSELEHHSRLEAIGQVAGSVAHDFNNMLTAILSYTDLQLQRTPNDDDAVRRYARGIQAAAERAAETTRQLLAFCRRKNKKLTELDVNEVIREAAALVRRLIGENVELVLELEPELPRILADAGQLNQVMVNLAVNARDAMPHGGKIFFVTAKHERNTATTGRFAGEPLRTDISIFVHDTGSGISAEVLPHIFDPFFTTKPQGKGTGLGLSTVYGIVKQSNGEILVTSEPGRGTTFEIVLPALAGSMALREESAPKATDVEVHPPILD